MLRGQHGIQIRVKGSHELMHLKAYLIDGSLLRDGSANWSPSGLKRQDNNAHFTSDRAQIAAFRQIFEQMWNRADNERVQCNFLFTKKVSTIWRQAICRGAARCAKFDSAVLLPAIVHRATGAIR